MVRRASSFVLEASLGPVTIPWGGGDLRRPAVARGLAPTTMNSTVTMAWEILDRMERAVAKVRERLLRATAVLNKAGVPYAVVDGHAVASWVATVDEGAVR